MMIHDITRYIIRIFNRTTGWAAIVKTFMYRTNDFKYSAVTIEENY